MIPSELLYLNKYACNRAMEMMGMRVGLDFIGKLHDFSHTFESTKEFFHIRAEEGLRAALEWRDGKFGDDYRALRKTATEQGTDFAFPQALSMPEVKEALEKFEAERKKQSQPKS